MLSFVNRVLSVLALAAMVFACVARPAAADIYPTSSFITSRAHAWIYPNPIGPPDTESAFGSTGDLTASTHAFDSTSAALSSEVTATTTCHVEPDGRTGTANIHIDWNAIDTLPPNTNPQPSGSFEGSGEFQYGFIADTNFDITIQVTCTSNANGSGDPAAFNAFSVNHEVRFLGDYYTLDLNDTETISATNLPPGFYQIYVVHFPNSGIAPWPNTHSIGDTNLSFTLSPYPPPPPTLGDMNCDSVVNVEDVEPMVMALIDPGLYAEFHGCIQNGDINADEQVDGKDLQGFVDLLTP